MSKETQKQPQPNPAAPQGQAGDGAQPRQAPQVPGPGVADMGDSASAQASTPATVTPGPTSAAVQAEQPPAAVSGMRTLFKTVRKITTASRATRMRNKSEQVAFFRGQRVKPGKTFTLPAGEPIGRWMEPIDDKVKDDLAALLEASPKTRGSAGVVLKDRRPQQASGFGALETGANRDEGI